MREVNPPSVSTDPFLVLLLSIVGVFFVLQQTPCWMGAGMPSSDIAPSTVAVVEPIPVTASVVTDGSLSVWNDTSLPYVVPKKSWVA